MRAWRVVYWFVTGAFLGLGLVSITGEGLILFPIGVILLLVGLFRLRGREAVAGVLGFGVLPEAAFVNALVTGFSTPFYYWGAVIFGVITLIGLVALVVVWRTQRRGAGPAAS
jgi:hypothetical protein